MILPFLAVQLAWGALSPALALDEGGGRAGVAYYALKFRTAGQQFSLSEGLGFIELYQRFTNYGVLEGRSAVSYLGESSQPGVPSWLKEAYNQLSFKDYCWGKAVLGTSVGDQIGVNWQLPRGFSLQVFGRGETGKTGAGDFINNYAANQITVRLTKALSWGKKTGVSGVKSGQEWLGTGIIEGWVFNDANLNGAIDSGESGVAGIKVKLEDGSTVVTDEKGHYQFPPVGAGKHIVSLDVRRIPAAYTFLGSETVSMEVQRRGSARVDFLPAESNTGMFGGNSNWRGPVWMPVNALIIRALLNFCLYYGDNFKIECPIGSGKMMNLFEVSQEIADRLSRIFTRDEHGRRPVYGGTEKFQTDPHWRDHILFY